MEKKKLHVISHTHWDREWYMSFEQHRMRLVELFDTLIPLMENDPSYRYFHMDGQWIVMEDYLEIRPQMKDRLYRLIRDGRIQAGPWYVLQDEYLISGEANVRNMLYGLRLCREAGAQPVMTGYFPDAFGNISQAPQILRQFGIDNAAFGRGTGRIGTNNRVDRNGPSNPSEILWRSPDGSEVFGAVFVQWYNNAMELPRDPEALKRRIGEMAAGLEESSVVPHLLALNGCDHQPVQTDLPEVLRTAQRLFDGRLDIVHSNFTDYMDAIRPYRDHFPLIEGEINGQFTSGENSLIETASAHVPLKQQNHRGQNMLERVAEPLSVISLLSGGRYRGDELFYAWKTLMKNHPHDSICCCSCDAVTREMETRFRKSFEAARFVAEEAMAETAGRIDTSRLGDRNIVVFHTSPFCTAGTVSVHVDFPDGCTPEALSIEEENGREIPCAVSPLGRVFSYTLPKDRFRTRSYVQRYQIRFPVTMEGIGWKTFTVQTKKNDCAGPVSLLPRGAENEFLSFSVEEDGSVTVTDRETGEVYRKNLLFADAGDRGDEYNFRPMDGEAPVFCTEGSSSFRIVEKTSFSVTAAVEQTLALPAGREGAHRCRRTVPHKITALLTLTAGIRRLDVEVVFDNQAADHRLRVLFQPEIETDHVWAEGQFDVVERPIQPAPSWKNPSNCQRMQSFFALSGGRRGFLVAVRGLNEYEILRDGQNTMALTLLRCVGEMGDWGDFPTPDAQCPGRHAFHFSLIPFDPSRKSQAFAAAFSFHGEEFSTAVTGCHGGAVSAEKIWFHAEGDGLAFSSLKKAEESNACVLRLYNTEDSPRPLRLFLDPSISAVCRTNLAETEREELPLDGRFVSVTADGKKIVTLLLHGKEETEKRG